MKPFSVCKDVYALGGPDITNPSDCCIYMIDAGGKLVLIDSGAGESFVQLVDNIGSLGFDPQHLTRVSGHHLCGPHPRAARRQSRR